MESKEENLNPTQMILEHFKNNSTDPIAGLLLAFLKELEEPPQPNVKKAGEA